MTSSDWQMINSPTYAQQLSPDPWLSGNFKVGGKKQQRTKKELYIIAKRLGISGRSYMSKAELESAIRKNKLSGKNK